jgi:hypothetical protein
MPWYKASKTWLICYCSLALTLTSPVLDALFPIQHWEVWSKFFREEVKARFANWRRDDGGPGTMGQGMVFRRRGCLIEEVQVVMEADDNVTFVTPLVDEDHPWLWSLILKKGVIWLRNPLTGRWDKLPPLGAEKKIKTFVRRLHRIAWHEARTP